MGIVYGYARVSTTGQCLDRQLDALTQAGVDKDLIYCEKMSGTKSNRPKLKALLETVEEGDTVYIESLSRLGRSSADLITLMQTFHNEGVTLISLKEKLDFGSAAGKMITRFIFLSRNPAYLRHIKISASLYQLFKCNNAMIYYCFSLCIYFFN